MQKDSDYLPKKYVQLKHPEWIKNAVLYELNIRQFSQEGTLVAIIPQLPRLRKMGIDIIWLMPVHPIGKLHRKGTLGSYYSVQDYFGVNPEFGTEADLRKLIKAIHQHGMYMILDWVANHTSWDNPLTTLHPEWYKKSADGRFLSTPWRDYDDIADLDYTKPELRKYMIKAMKYWVQDFDIDGYRCDIAAFVPLDFWEQARKELDQIKPVFMLAEAEDRDLHRHAFDATYNWTLWNTLHRIAVHNASVKLLTEAYLAEHVSIFPKDGIRMNFIDNHDKNSWEGTQYLNFGDALKAATVFTFLMDGMPLVYSGQEAGLDRSLEFFDKDPVEWKHSDLEMLYTQLFALKHQNKALWNGNWGGEMIRIMNSTMDQAVSFVREKDGDCVLAVFNFSAKPITIHLQIGEYCGNYQKLFSEERLEISGDLQLHLQAWDYWVIHKKHKKS